MATVYNNEVTVGQSLSGTAGVPWVSANNTFTAHLISLSAGAGFNTDSRVAFNNTANALTTAAVFINTFANTAGTTVSSGVGSITYNRSLSGTPIFVVMPDRTSFAGTLSSGSATIALTSNGYEGWGPNQVRLRTLGYF